MTRLNGSCSGSSRIASKPEVICCSEWPTACTESDVSRDTLVALTLTLVQPGTLRTRLQLSNSGRVVRVETRFGKSAIAIECDRAFEQFKAIHAT